MAETKLLRPIREGAMSIRFYLTNRARILAIPVIALIMTGCSLIPPSNVVVFRNSYGAVDLILNPTPLRFGANGVIDGDPAAIRLDSGDIVIAGREPKGQIFANTFDHLTWKWKGWQALNGQAKYHPSLATLGGKVFVSIVDQKGETLITVFSQEQPNRSWEPLGGSFDSPPQLQACGGNEMWLIGRGAEGTVEFMRLDANGRSRTSWGSTGYKLSGRISPLCRGNELLLMGRNDSGAIGFGRLNREGAWPWVETAQISARDADAAIAEDRIWLAALNEHGNVLLMSLNAATLAPIGTWEQVGDAAKTVSVSVWNGVPYLFARLEYEGIARWRGTDRKWKMVGTNATGTLQLAPK